MPETFGSQIVGAGQLGPSSSLHSSSLQPLVTCLFGSRLLSRIEFASGDAGSQTAPVGQTAPSSQPVGRQPCAFANGWPGSQRVARRAQSASLLHWGRGRCGSGADARTERARRQRRVARPATGAVTVPAGVVLRAGRNTRAVAFRCVALRTDTARATIAPAGRALTRGRAAGARSRAHVRSAARTRGVRFRRARRGTARCERRDPERDCHGHGTSWHEALAHRLQSRK